MDRFFARYAKAVERKGKYLDEVETGSLFSSYLALVDAPDAALVQELEPAGKTDLFRMGAAFWCRAKFEKGEVYVAIELSAGANQMEMQQRFQDAQPNQDANSLEPFPIASDVRIFEIK